MFAPPTAIYTPAPGLNNTFTKKGILLKNTLLIKKCFCIKETNLKTILLIKGPSLGFIYIESNLY